MQQSFYQQFDGSIFENVIADGHAYTINPAFRVFGYSDAIRTLENAKHRIPQRDPNYVFDLDTLMDVITWLQMPNGTGLWLTGPTGCGKTSIINEVAARLNWPVVAQTMTGRFEFSDLKGQFVLTQAPGESEPHMRYQHNALALAMKYGWILRIDEVDLADPAELSGLNDVLEGRPLVISENGGEVINPHPMFRLVVTGNSAGQGDDTGLYQGIQQQNVAALDRYRLLKVDYSSKAELLLLKKIASDMPGTVLNRCVKLAKKIREAHAKGTLSIPFSTRTLRNWVSTSRLYRGNSQIRNPLRKSLMLHFMNRLTAAEVCAVDECARVIFGESWVGETNGN